MCRQTSVGTTALAYHPILTLYKRPIKKWSLVTPRSRPKHPAASTQVQVLYLRTQIQSVKYVNSLNSYSNLVLVILKNVLILTQKAFVVPFIYAYIRFMYVPWPGIEPTTLVYQDKTPTSWATQPTLLGCSYDPHCTDEEIKAERGWITCPRQTPSNWWPGFEPR